MRTADDILQCIVDKRGGSLESFRDRNNPDETIQTNRRIAAVLLGEFWGNSRDDRISIRLNCSPSFLELAYRLSQEDELFRSELAHFCHKDLPKPVVPALDRKAEAALAFASLSNAQKLKRIAREEFGFEWRNILINTHVASTARVRQRLIVLARDYLSMTREEVAEALETRIVSVDQAAHVGSEMVEHDLKFKKEIRRICERYGIPFVRNRRSLEKQ